MHTKVRSWWERCLSGTETVGLAWVAAYGLPEDNDEVEGFRESRTGPDSNRQVRSWLERPQVQILHSGERHSEIFVDYLNQLGTAANLTTDAHLAALAQEYQAVLHTAD